MSQKLEDSKKGGAHALLQKMIGNWKGTTKTWFEPDKLANESPARGTIKPLMDGRFVLHEYQGSMEGKPFEGFAIYGCCLTTDQFQSAWIDSFHTGTAIMFSQGEKDNNTISVTGSYAYKAPDDVMHHWSWRTELKMNGNDELIIRAYNVPPDGEEVLGVETVLGRV